MAFGMYSFCVVAIISIETGVHAAISTPWWTELQRPRISLLNAANRIRHSTQKTALKSTPRNAMKSLTKSMRLVAFSSKHPNICVNDSLRNVGRLPLCCIKLAQQQLMYPNNNCSTHEEPKNYIDCSAINPPSCQYCCIVK